MNLRAQPDGWPMLALRVPSRTVRSYGNKYRREHRQTVPPTALLILGGTLDHEENEPVGTVVGVFQDTCWIRMEMRLATI